MPHKPLYKPMKPLNSQAVQECLDELSAEAQADIEALLTEIESVLKNHGARSFGRHSTLELLAQCIRKGVI